MGFNQNSNCFIALCFTALCFTGLGLGGLLLSCSSTPVKFQCSEIQTRIDYGNLSSDQYRFAMEELEDCRGRQREAEKKDSALIDKTENKFTPQSDLALEPDSGKAASDSSMGTKNIESREQKVK